MNVFRLILALFLVPISVSFCFAQDVTLWNQADVDAFNPTTMTIAGFLKIGVFGSSDPITDISNLSNLNFVGGDLSISSSLMNLDDLSNLTLVAGNLSITGNNVLTNVNGLFNLTSLGGSISVLNNTALLNVDGLSSITSVSETLDIGDNNELSNIDGISNLISVGGDLRIISNPMLMSVVGLSNLTSVGGDLLLSDNSALTNLDGLSSIVSISGSLSIYRNALTNVDGLLNLTSVGDLFIDNSFELTNVDGLSGLRSVNGSLAIHFNGLMNVDGLSGLTSISGNLYIAVNALTNVDGFSSLTSVGGNLTIDDNDSLTNVDGFSSLTSVGGYLKIEKNSMLTNVDGLSGLTSIGGYLRILYNGSLTNVDGLSSLTSVGGYMSIYGSYSLTNVDGLYNLASVGGYLSINEIYSLTNVDGLSGLTSIGGYLIIGSSQSLTNVDGLSSIISITGSLNIEFNQSLTNLEGLSCISSVGGGVSIQGNSELMDCCGIQNLLSIPGAIVGSINIINRSIECSSESEILNSSCSYAYIFNDINEDCDRGLDENGLWSIRAEVDPGNYIFESEGSGAIDLEELPLGSYTITIDTNSGLWTTDCPITQDFEVFINDSISDIAPFPLTSTDPCNEPQVTLQMPRARPCFENQRIYVEACNKPFATGAIEGAYVVVSLDSILTYQGAEHQSTVLDDYTYQFELGDINPGQCVDFWIDAMVSCDAVLGQSLCLQADLYPTMPCIFGRPAPVSIVPTSCSTPYDDSYITVDGYCDGDSLHFEIENTSMGDMTCYSPIRFYVDGELEDKDSTMLVAGGREIIKLEADGRTWRMEVDQHPNHPEYSRPNATIELCGDPDNWTSGIVNTMYQDDASPVVDIFCTEVRGSYDPNDKTGYPLGITDQHYVLPNQQMEYRIRFQNTGTDTAFTVVIRDTLDLDFDIFSVESGVSSHDYEFELYGPRVLQWTFNNILLVDSTTNEPGSHGFVTFQVRQNLDLENDTELNNSAGIYFDFNDPVITNVTSHVVHDQIQQSVLSATNDLIKQNNLFKLYPNPTNGNIRIDLDKNYRKINVEVFSILGQRIAQYNYEHEDLIELNMDNSSGVYLVKVKTDSGYGQSFRVMVSE